MLLKLGRVQLWSPAVSHVAGKLLYKPECVYALAHVQVLGEQTPFQSHAGSPTHPFPTFFGQLACWPRPGVVHAL